MNIRFKNNVNEEVKVEVILELAEIFNISVSDIKEHLADSSYENIPEQFQKYFEVIPETMSEIRTYLKSHTSNVKKALYDLFPDKKSREINELALDFEDYMVSAMDNDTIIDLDEIEEVKIDVICDKYPVYNVVKNDIIVIAGQSNVGKSYHCGLMFRVMSDLDKLYIAPDQGKFQCAAMLKRYQVKNCMIDEQPNLHFAMNAYKNKKGKYPDVVCYDMLSSLPSTGMSDIERQSSRAQELRRIKSAYPNTTFFFVAEIRKSDDKYGEKEMTTDDLMGSSMLAYKSDLVVGIYNKNETITDFEGNVDKVKTTYMKVLKARIGNTRDIEYCLGHNESNINGEVERWAINNAPKVKSQDF